MFERWDSSQVVMFAVGADSHQLSEFTDVFGWRSVGLIDPSSSLYSSWRVPQPLAPYPQDYIVDQDGVVRYWSDQYDAQAVIQTVDRLLATGVGERAGGPDQMQRLRLTLSPNPAAGAVRLQALGLAGGGGTVEVLDVSGAVLDRFEVGTENPFTWRPEAPAGVYYFRLVSGDDEVATPSVLVR
ncbi:MAG: hypothetical protein JSU73_02605 [candidate division WOR-3 bacterium]|nr:MAG: hypothetical protein JSU73_02605 [candidate division WOR-3 bacterium]